MWFLGLVGNLVMGLLHPSSLVHPCLTGIRLVFNPVLIAHQLLSHLEHSPRHCSGTRRWWHHPLRDSSLWWRLLSIGIHLLHARHALPRPILFHIRCSGCAGLKSGVLDAHAARHSQLILCVAVAVAGATLCLVFRTGVMNIIVSVVEAVICIGLNLYDGDEPILCHPSLRDATLQPSLQLRHGGTSSSLWHTTTSLASWGMAVPALAARRRG